MNGNDSDFKSKIQRGFASAMSQRGHSSLALKRQKTLHSGWLMKQGGWPRTLRRRWFEIKGDQMYYFRDKNDQRPIASIPLAGNQVVKRPATPDSNNKFMFELIAGAQREGRPISDGHDSFLFIARTQTDMDDWIKAINRVIYEPLGGGMFGRSLEDTVRVDSRRGGGMVPIILEKCVDFIKQHGTCEEGIFRLPGELSRVEELKDDFNRGEVPDITPANTNVHTVGSLLKAYLRDLPEPVIPYDFYDKFLEAAQTYKQSQLEGLDEMKSLFDMMPRANFNVLKYLSRFLNELLTHSEQTKMGLQNFAIVFGPNILSPLSEDPAMLMESSSLINKLTECFISHDSVLFPPSDDERYYTPLTLTSRPKSPFEANLMDFGNVSPALGFECTLPRPSSLENILEGLSVPEPPLLSPTTGEERLIDKKGDSLEYDGPVMDLVSELELQRSQFEEQIRELEAKLDAEQKIREMIKIRLHDEHRARLYAERRLELYKNGIEEFCQKFGGVDIKF